MYYVESTRNSNAIPVSYTVKYSTGIKENIDGVLSLVFHEDMLPSHLIGKKGGMTTDPMTVQHLRWHLKKIDHVLYLNLEIFATLPVTDMRV